MTSNTHRRRSLLRCALAVVLAGATGCPPHDAVVDGPAQAPADLPTNREVVERFNRGSARLKRLWASSVVELRWTEEDGRKRFEQGDGNLVMRLPDELAFSLGKLGNVLMWAGADAERYWLFDLIGKPKTVFFGRHDQAGEANAARLGLPMRPRDLPRLLGLKPIAVDEAVADKPVTDRDGVYVIDLAGARARLHLTPGTYRLVRVELLNGQGEPTLVGELSRHARVEVTGAPPGAWPYIPTRLEAYVVGTDARMTLFLSNLTDDADRIRDKAFDLDVLIRALKAEKQVDLDAQ